MAITPQRQSANQETLQHRWLERCRQRNFSPMVLGIGTVRVFGRSGDAPVTYPRIDTLAVMDALEEDERWAIEVAHGLVSAAQERHRPVMATQPPRVGTSPMPTPVREFDPKVEHILILSLTRGG